MLDREQIIRQYLHQIYLPPDTIVDRMMTKQVEVENSGKVIEAMIGLFMKHIHSEKVNNNLKKYLQYISDVAEELAIEKEPLLKKFKNRYKELIEGEIQDDSLFFMSTLSVLIEGFQRKIVKRYTLKLKRKIPKITIEETQKKLEYLFQVGDSNFSLIVNIETMREMERILGVKMGFVNIEPFEKELIRTIVDLQI